MGTWRYKSTNQEIAAGPREFFIDPDTKESFLLTGYKRVGMTLVYTMREIYWDVPVVVPDPNQPPVGSAITLEYEVASS